MPMISVFSFISLWRIIRFIKNYTIEQFEVHDLERLEPVDIEEYQEYLKVYKNDEEKCITNTEKGLARKMSALRSFYGYYFKRQIISKNPTLLVEMPKLHEKAIIRLDTDEIAMLLDYVDHGGDNLTGQRKAYFENDKNSRSGNSDASAWNRNPCIRMCWTGSSGY